MTNNTRFRDQLESLYGISVQIASLRDLSEVYDLALTFCLALTQSEMGFIDLLNEDHIDMDVVAVKGFVPSRSQILRALQTYARPPQHLPGSRSQKTARISPTMSSMTRRGWASHPAIPPSGPFSACRSGWAGK